MRAARAALDEIDWGIVEALRSDGRLANSEVARTLGVSEATVRRRIHRLVTRRVLKVVALTNPRALGLEMETLIGLNVEPARLDDVARALSPLPEVRFLGLAMGAFDILIVARFRSLEEWLGFQSQVAKRPGIQQLQTFQIVKVTKRTYDWIFEGPDTSADQAPTRRASTLTSARVRSPRARKKRASPARSSA